MSNFLLITFLILSISSAEASEHNSYYLNENPSDSVDALTIFSAKIKNKTVYLNWRILNPRSVSYFEVYRFDSRNNNYIKISEEKIKKEDYLDKTRNTDGKWLYMYDFEDQPERDGAYYYILKGYNQAGNEIFESDEIKIGVTGIRNFNLEQNTPNPFNPLTNISYELFEPSYVSLKVFDLIGKEIATLHEGYQGKGKYTYQFDASRYENLTSGIYFYKLETEKYSEVKKMILTK